eukprot:COSAG01_NODE_8491_length_2766_cov_7.029246_3_plen_164_part_00
MYYDVYLISLSSNYEYIELSARHAILIMIREKSCSSLSGVSSALYNNNNDALLSQTWVIATTAVLRVRTVPDVEPHTPGMTSPGLFSSCGRAPARRCCGAAHDVPHAWLAQEAPPGGSTLPTPQERAHCPLGSSPCSPRAADRSTNNITRARSVPALNIQARL